MLNVHMCYIYMSIPMCVSQWMLFMVWATRRRGIARRGGYSIDIICAGLGLLMDCFHLV